jgi:hypothetical protein
MAVRLGPIGNRVKWRLAARRLPWRNQAQEILVQVCVPHGHDLHNDQRDVFLKVGGPTSACGTAADGILGCFDGGQMEITLVQGWDWYAGADPGAIAAGQYDFESVVVHELGHAVGLGHSADAGSVMYPTLAAGAAHRDLSVADLDVADDDGGAHGLHAAPNAPASRLDVFGQAGNDGIQLAAAIGSTPMSVAVLAVFDGGSENHLLFGGRGADLLHGAGGDAILLSGTTAYDLDFPAFGALAAEWARTDADHAQRAADLVGTTPGGLTCTTFLDPAAVQADSVRNRLFGDSAQDWLRSGVADLTADLAPGADITAI